MKIFPARLCFSKTEKRIIGLDHFCKTQLPKCVLNKADAFDGKYFEFDSVTLICRPRPNTKSEQSLKTTTTNFVSHLDSKFLRVVSTKMQIFLVLPPWAMCKHFLLSRGSSSGFGIDRFCPSKEKALFAASNVEFARSTDEKTARVAFKAGETSIERLSPAPTTNQRRTMMIQS